MASMLEVNTWVVKAGAVWMGEWNGILLCLVGCKGRWGMNWNC